MVQNPDRKTDNPNAAMLNGEVVAFDFEMCFSFVRMLSLPGISPEAWEVDADMAQKHLFHKGLWAKEQDWGTMLACLNSLNYGTMEQALAELLRVFPPSTPNFADKVLRHLCDVKSNASSFCMALDRNLR